MLCHYEMALRSLTISESEIIVRLRLGNLRHNVTLCLSFPNRVRKILSVISSESVSFMELKHRSRVHDDMNATLNVTHSLPNGVSGRLRKSHGLPFSKLPGHPLDRGGGREPLLRRRAMLQEEAGTARRLHESQPVRRGTFQVFQRSGQNRQYFVAFLRFLNWITWTRASYLPGHATRPPPTSLSSPPPTSSSSPLPTLSPIRAEKRVFDRVLDVNARIIYPIREEAGSVEPCDRLCAK